MSEPQVTSRQALRAAAVRALIEANTLAGGNVFATRTWPLQQGQMPAILIYTYNERNESLNTLSADAHFRTHLDLMVLIRAEAIESDVEAQVDTMIEQTKVALLTNVAFRNLVDWFGGMTTRITYGDHEQLSYAEVEIVIDCVYDEIFPANVTSDYGGVNLYVDAASVAVDKEGTYDSEFPVPPAPRTHGPDGRAEISAGIDNT